MYLGVDLGTSGLKLVLLDDDLAAAATATAPLTVASAYDYWSEQNPADWWDGLQQALTSLRAQLGVATLPVTALGLSGQMHGAVVLDAQCRPLRPVILWNDGRSHREAKMLLEAVPDIGGIGGVTPMPGFTAPKIMWLQRNEPATYAQIAHVLLPKDYLGLRLHGELATDYSDAAGTLWFDQRRRAWAPQLCAASATDPAWLPRCYAGSACAGTLRDEVAAQLHLPPGIPVAAGGGDAATGAVSVGATVDSVSFISLGTSGQLFVATDTYRPNPQQLVHAFAHCVPDMWYQMAAMLNGARPLSWFAKVTSTTVPQLLDEAQHCTTTRLPLFLPYLTGERSPHGDPHIRGAFYGLDNHTGRAEMMCAVIEAVAFCFADAVASFAATGTELHNPLAIGGGAQSDLVLQTIADATGLTIRRGTGAGTGPAFGAARLAAVLDGRLSHAELATASTTEQVFTADPSRRDRIQERLEKFRTLYRVLKPLGSLS